MTNYERTGRRGKITECQICRNKIEDKKIIETKDNIIKELHKAIGLLGGMSDILCITGSFKDTQSDEEVLKDLIIWNDLPRRGKVRGGVNNGVM